MLEAIGAVIVAVLAAFFLGNRRGKSSAKQEAKEADNARAETIRDKADAARKRPAGDAIDRLQRSKHLRD
jgi:hypothetical protein